VLKQNLTDVLGCTYGLSLCNRKSPEINPIRLVLQWRCASFVFCRWPVRMSVRLQTSRTMSWLASVSTCQLKWFLQIGYYILFVIRAYLSASWTRNRLVWKDIYGTKVRRVCRRAALLHTLRRCPASYRMSKAMQQAPAFWSVFFISVRSAYRVEFSWLFKLRFINTTVLWLLWTSQ